jgi:sortase (surface protein transpeptidase)
VGRRATVVALAASSVTVVAGSQAATVVGLAVGVPAAAAADPTPSSDGVHSVRTYDAVAEPVRLRIPAAGVDTPLERLHRAADGSIEVPTDFGVAGWFAEGPRPGQPGPAVILGHVDSRAGPAVFFRLKDLPAGAEVVVGRADGSTVAFRVRSTLHVPKVEFPTEAVYGPTLEPSLRLVTCGGSFDPAARSYRDNVIVYADPTG